MLVQGKAHLLLLMCLSMPCPAKTAALEQAVRPLEQAMAYLNIRLRIRAIHYGLASRIAQVAGRELKRSIVEDSMAAMAALMAETATRNIMISCQVPLAAQAAVTVAALGVTSLLGEVEMQHIMVRVPAVADIVTLPGTMAAAAIKA